MRTKEHTYESTLERAEEILASLDKNGYLLPQCKTAWQEYRKFADPVSGRPQPNIPWNQYANPRAGYQFDVPGLVTEIITMGCLAKLVDATQLSLAQDKKTQVEDKIDILIENYSAIPSVQCKTIRFSGQRATFNRGYFQGVATHLSLIDIDDKVCYVIDREKLAELSTKNKGYVYIWDLNEIAQEKVDLKPIY